MAPQNIPKAPGARREVSKPIPDLMFGYTDAAFTGELADTIVDINLSASSKVSLFLPFLVVEFKADSGSLRGGHPSVRRRCCLVRLPS